MANVPDRPGFYWARWMQPSDELEDGPYDYTPGPFEPVELVDADGIMVVEMMAIPTQQPAENFYWDARLQPPAGQPKDIEKTGPVDERAAAAFRRMTMAERIEAYENRKRK
jgi:hypothetical protein